MSFEEIRENFSLLDEWEDRYRYLIELGRALEPMPEALKTDATKVRGCASQVWMRSKVVEPPDGGGAANGPRLSFEGESDAHIVQGLIAVLLAIHNNKAAKTIVETDTDALFNELGLKDHLTPQRSNGLASMITRIKSDARQALETAGTD